MNETIKNVVAVIKDYPTQRTLRLGCVRKFASSLFNLSYDLCEG